MQKLILLFLSLVCLQVFGQTLSTDYKRQIMKADSLYHIHNYQQAASAYSDAFKLNNNRGLVDDRYNAAQCYALSGNIESAFYNLFRIAERTGWNKYDTLVSDTNFNSLHKDERWNKLVNKVRSNKAESDAEKK